MNSACEIHWHRSSVTGIVSGFFAVRERLRQIFEEARKGEQGPGITPEELPGFLREHEQ